LKLETMLSCQQITESVIQNKAANQFTNATKYRIVHNAYVYWGKLHKVFIKDIKFSKISV